jgi:hypothetical protein
MNNVFPVSCVTAMFCPYGPIPSLPHCVTWRDKNCTTPWFSREVRSITIVVGEDQFLYLTYVFITTTSFLQTSQADLGLEPVPGGSRWYQTASIFLGQAVLGGCHFPAYHNIHPPRDSQPVETDENHPRK